MWVGGVDLSPSCQLDYISPHPALVRLEPFQSHRCLVSPAAFRECGKPAWLELGASAHVESSSRSSSSLSPVTAICTHDAVAGPDGPHESQTRYFAGPYEWAAAAPKDGGH